MPDLEELYDWYGPHQAWLRGSTRGSRAHLSGAHLSGAKGITLLTQTDHGYLAYAVEREGEWRIHAGCRDFTMAEARAHWSSPNYHTPSSGRRILAALDWLESERFRGKEACPGCVDCGPPIVVRAEIRCGKKEG